MNAQLIEAAAVKGGAAAPPLTGRRLADAIRALSMDAVQRADSGHPGLPMGMADVATVLFTRFLKFDAAAPDWADRDRFVLSAGHGSMLLYSLLHLCGYADMGIEQLRNFRQLGAITAGHPEYGHAAGVEMTTGPLGQGIATAVGMALAERSLAAQFGGELVDHHTWVLAGDGCLMEGLSHEALDFAGRQRLGKLIVLFDDNHISIDGDTALATDTDQCARFAAAGWQVARVDGHDHAAIAAAIEAARASRQPSLIACRTTIGFGSPNKAGSAATHGAPLGEEEVAATRAALGWESPPFEIPADLLAVWRAAGARGGAAREAWEDRLLGADAALRGEFQRRLAGQLPEDFEACIDALKREFSEQQPLLATRQSSQRVLERLTARVPGLIGGSADLSGSNGTRTAAHSDLDADNPAGNYIRYGVREHGMAAAMNGLALHGGFMPYGGTFLVFADYSRPAIRLGALMGQRVVHVMSHDSIGLGEDGPTHQPVEHLAALRAMPGLRLFRPADAVEVAEAWGCALHAAQPSLLCLSRQGLATLRTRHTEVNLTARGAYVIREAGQMGGAHSVADGASRDATLLATGSEVCLAVRAAALLGEVGIRAAVVSMPCWELFAEQHRDYRQRVLGSVPRFAVEAAAAFGWGRWLEDEADFIGMPGFGASAPAEDLYRHFGITAEALCARVRERLGR